MFVCAVGCVCMYAHTHACACVCMCACVHVCMHTCAFVLVVVVVCVARCVLYGVCCAHPLRRVLRKCATANRTSSFAPRYAENGSGDVTGELPQVRMLITATCVCVCVCVCSRA